MGAHVAQIERDLRMRMVYEAVQCLGRRYVWAANGPSLFDCSGFVLHVIRRSGVDPDIGDMRARDMAHWPKVAEADVLPGDICLYSRTDLDGDGDVEDDDATHVTMALVPWGRIIIGANGGRSFKGAGLDVPRWAEFKHLSTAQQAKYLAEMERRNAKVRIEYEGWSYRSDFLGFHRPPFLHTRQGANP